MSLTMQTLSRVRSCDELTAWRLLLERKRAIAERRWVLRHHWRLQLLADIREAVGRLETTPQTN